MPCFFSRLRINARPALWGAVSFVLLFIASAMCSVVAMAAVVSLQPPPTNEALLRIPVILTGEGDEDLAGVQFDLNYDPTQYSLEAIETGAAASDAGKNVILSQPTSGRGRILITGFNDNTLFDGHVATLILRPRTSDAAAHSLIIDNLLATDPLGSSVHIEYANDYAYPPLPPEKTESDLTESAEESTQEEETGFDTALTEEGTEESALSFEENTFPQDSTTSGYGGALVTPPSSASSSRTPQNSLRQNSPSYLPPVLSNNSGASAPTRSSNGAARPPSRNTRTGIESRNARATGVLPARPATRASSTETIEEPPSARPTSEYRRLALVMPTASVITPSGTPPIAGTLLSDETPLFQPRSDYRIVGVALFLMFFLGFAALHIKIFRWLSGSTWRRHS